MRSLILNRTNSNDPGCRRDRLIVAVINELRAALRASFSFFRHADEALAGYRVSFERLLPAMLAVPAAAVPTIQPATSMSPTLGSFGPQGRVDRQGCWHSKHGVRHASERKS